MSDAASHSHLLVTSNTSTKYQDYERLIQDFPAWDFHTAGSLGDKEYFQQHLVNCSSLKIYLQPNREGWTPLMFASYFGHTQLLEYFLHNTRCHHQQHTPDGRTLLMLAACGGHINTIQLLCNTRRSTLDAQDHYGHTALYHAIHWGHQEAVKLLLSNGADPNIQESFAGLSPLMLACCDGLELIVRSLLEFKSDTKLKSHEGITARDYAVKGGFTKVAALFPGSNKTDAPDLLALLDKWGLVEYKQLFIKEEIDFDIFLTMSDDDLKEIGITRLGLRKKFLCLIKRLNVIRSCPPQFQCLLHHMHF